METEQPTNINKNGNHNDDHCDQNANGDEAPVLTSIHVTKSITSDRVTLMTMPMNEAIESPATAGAPSTTIATNTTTDTVVTQPPIEVTGVEEASSTMNTVLLQQKTSLSSPTIQQQTQQCTAVTTTSTTSTTAEIVTMALQQQQQQVSSPTNEAPPAAALEKPDQQIEYVQHHQQQKHKKRRKGSTSATSTTASTTHHRRHNKKIIVIGCGMAGLSVARELQHRGYNILMIEASNRLGGRCKTYNMTTASQSPQQPPPPHPTITAPTTTGKQHKKGNANDKSSNNNAKIIHNNSNSNNKNGNTGIKQEQKQKPSLSSTDTSSNSTATTPIDMGGALIHGIVDNPLYTLVHDHMNIATQSITDECVLFLRSTGWPIDVQQDKYISQLFNQCLSETFQRVAQSNDQNSNSSSDAADTTRSDKNRHSLKPLSSSHTKPSSFGDVFEQVCKEKNTNAVNTPLFQWYQNNLELSCGTSFQNLGYTWNDDEIYGFDGSHNAIIGSWKQIIQTLGETLYVLYNSPVSKIQIVYPKPDDIILHEQQIQKMKEARASSSTLATTTNPQQQELSNKRVKTIHSRKQQHEMASKIKAIEEPIRQSKRIRGQDVNDVRRSHRPNKGKLTTSLFTTTATATATGSSSKKRTHDDDKKKSKNVSSETKVPKIKTTVQVTIQSGITFEADAVICTVPLGILKENDTNTIVFDPPLPMEKQLAIQQLGTGLYNKCAITFTKQFWQNADFLGVVNDLQQSQQLHNPIAQHHHSYLILNATKYTNQPILIFLYGGAFAKEIESWTDYEIMTDCLSILRKICGKDSVTVPIDYHVTRWGHEPYSQMSFTYVPPGVDGMKELKTMSQPIYDHTGKVPVLMFAGEHTTPYHPSTIHGAYLSGIREAYRYDCALQPAANNFLVFTEDNIYERTFMIRQRNSTKATSSTTAPAKNLPIGENGTTSSILSSAPAKSRFQSYARRRFRDCKNNNGGMILRHRPTTFFPLNTTGPKTSTITVKKEASLLNGGRSATSLTHISTSTTLPTRRSQRHNVTSDPPEITSKQNSIPTETRAKPVASPSRRSQRTVTSTTPLLVTSSAPQQRLFDDIYGGDNSATSTLSVRDRTIFENRILQRSIESYGPNYEYISKMTLPIYHGEKNDNVNSTIIDKDQLEDRCKKLLRKTERINAQREATVLHYYKSWIATTVAPPSTIIRDKTKKESRETKNSKQSIIPSISGKVNGNIQSSIVAPVAPPTKTRYGRTSRPPS